MLIEPNLEDDVEFFIEEEDDGPLEPELLDELPQPPKPPIELEPPILTRIHMYINFLQDMF
jgi:hypothetical protein